jgi:mRNA interferase MazF
LARQYTPERGDIVWLEFNPQAGHEQRGTRPVLVISPGPYNRRVGLALFCPLTTQVKGYPFEVRLPPDIQAKGAILSDQVKSLDWRARKAKLLCKAPPEVVEETLARVLALIEPEGPAPKKLPR